MGAAQELVVLCDEQGRPTGSAEKSSVHHGETPLHLAFSCYVFGDDGALLTTRRALTKQVWPGAWSNTVCGHPAPGETYADAIARRLDHELGMTARDVEVVLPDHVYRAPPFYGIVEYEFCPVFVARHVSGPTLNPVEVGDCAWMAWDEFAERAAGDSGDVWSWWCKNQLRELRDHPLIERYAAGARR